ncbi:hypothetical protein Aduo_012075 [Ancylostoma duodenale]
MTLNLKRWIEENDSSFPETRELGEVGPVRFHFLVDSGFGQNFRLVRPHPNKGDGYMSRMRFNRKLSGARRLIEPTVGILCRRFVVLPKPIEPNPVKTSRLVISLMILHNLVARRKDALRDVERYPPYESPLTPPHNQGGSEGAGSAETARDKLRQHHDPLYKI